MAFTLHVENLRALRKVEWSPEGVCTLVGPNGAGKSTLLMTLDFLAKTYRHDKATALRMAFVSTYGLRNRHAADWERIAISVVNGVTMSVTFDQDGSLHLDRLDGSGDLLRKIAVFHDPDLWSLRMDGSPNTDTSHLHSRGLNVFSVLHMWHGRREQRHRYQFVLDGLRAAFPSQCADLDFESAGLKTLIRVWAPGSELPTPVAIEANGVLAMLVYLCDIASGEPGGLVAIDEPENSLHPHALRELVDSAQAWSEAHDITIVFATHSPVILNAINNPERVWVMRGDAGDTPNPTRLDHLKNPDWLRQFTLGTLYANGQIGSNDDAA